MVEQTGLLCHSWTDLSDLDLTSEMQKTTVSSSPRIGGKQRQQMVESTHIVGLVIPPPPTPVLAAGANVRICGSIESVCERSLGTASNYCLFTELPIGAIYNHGNFTLTFQERPRLVHQLFKILTL